MSHHDCLGDHFKEKITALETKLKEAERLGDKIATHAGHEDDCILSFRQAGEPTPDGGYRTMYAGKWYQTKPVDNTPKCQCGCDDDWNAWQAFRSNKV